MKKYIIPAIITLVLPFIAFAINVAYPVDGGTGTYLTPSYGQILMGNGSGIYTPVATSSLGIIGGGTSNWATTSTDYWATSYSGLLTASNLNISNIATTTELCFATGECMTSPNIEGTNLVFYPRNTASDIATYEDMLSNPTGNGAVDESCAASSGTNGGYCTIDTYISTTTDVSIFNYPAGTTRVHAYTYVSSAAGESYLVLDGYKRDTAGNEVWIGQATTTEINYLAIQESEATFTGASDIAFNADGTDRFVMKIRGYTASAAPITIHWTYQSSGYYSQIETPITLSDEGYTRKSADETILGNWTFSVPPILSSLGVPAGSFLAVSPTGAVIATTSPATYGDTDVNAYIHASTTIPKTYTENIFTAIQNFATGIFTTLTTNGTASSTSLVVSDNFVTVGSKKIYSDWEDLGISIAQPTTTDEVYKPMLKCLPPGSPSITIENVYGIIASTTYMGTENTQGMTFNINIAQSPSSTTPMTVFSSAVNLYSTSSQQTFTPTGTATIPANYCYWFVFPTASTSQVGVAGFGLTGKKN